MCSSMMSNISLSAGINVTLPSVEETLVYYLGEKRKDTGSVVVLTLIYVCVFISGTVGNMSTCVVIARNPYMHTVTNYYLFSLAISDLLILLSGLPPELYSIWEAYPWRFGEGFCIFRSFIIEMMSYSSVLTITAFTVERYIAICHPIKAQTLSNLPRAIKIICIIWILSAVFAVPYPVHTRLYYYVPYNGTDLRDSLVCNIPLKWLTQMKHVFQMSAFVFFIFPMALITVMYILIGRALNQSDFHPKHHSNDKHSTKTRARNAVIKMLVAVVVAFFCCWAPFNAQRLMTSYVSKWTPLLMEIQSTLFYISGVLYYIGATVNPLLYNLMSKKYRMAFKRTLCRCIYTQEELMELSVRSKSVLVYSDRSPNSRRTVYRSNHQKFLHVQNIHRSKSGSALLSLSDSNLSRTNNVSNISSNSSSRTWNNQGYNSRPESPTRWTSTSPNRANSNLLCTESKKSYTGSQTLNFSSNSLIKVASTASVISFAELQQEIFVELNNSKTQLCRPETILLKDRKQKLTSNSFNNKLI